jgi:hypothetical protein
MGNLSDRVGGGGPSSATLITADYTILASNGENIVVNCDLGPVAITLHETPDDGAIVDIATEGATGINTVTISSTIHDINDETILVIDIEAGSVRLVYSGTKWVTGLDGYISSGMGAQDDQIASEVPTTIQNGVTTADVQLELEAIHTSISGLVLGDVDQTGAEIKVAYEAEADTNAFTDADASAVSANTAKVSNIVQDSTTVGTTIPDGLGNLLVSDDTVQKALDTLDGLALGGGTDDQTAVEVVVTATGFTGNLSGTDTDVQTALDTLDGITLGGEPDASTTVKGIVELATSSEMNTGTDGTRALTPSALTNSTYLSTLNGKTLQATTTTLGISELATQTEVNTGTSTTRVVTPSTLANYTGIKDRGTVLFDGDLSNGGANDINFIDIPWNTSWSTDYDYVEFHVEEGGVSSTGDIAFALWNGTNNVWWGINGSGSDGAVTWTSTPMQLNWTFSGIMRMDINRYVKNTILTNFSVYGIGSDSNAPSNSVQGFSGLYNDGTHAITSLANMAVWRGFYTGSFPGFPSGWFFRFVTDAGNFVKGDIRLIGYNYV